MYSYPSEYSFSPSYTWTNLAMGSRESSKKNVQFQFKTFVTWLGNHMNTLVWSIPLVWLDSRVEQKHRQKNHIVYNKKI